jgi:hypothetical protein
MRALAHLFALILILPQLLLVAAVETLGHVLAGGTLRSLLMNVLDAINLLFGWGGLAAIAGVLLLAGAGCFPSSRPAAAICVIALALGSTIDLTVRMGVQHALRESLLFLPALIAIGLSAWTMNRGAVLANSRG